MQTLSATRLFALTLVVFIAGTCGFTINRVAAENNLPAHKYQGERASEYQIGRVPELTTTSYYLERLPSDEQMKMIISFKPTDEAGLLGLINELYDPNAPRYHQWLTPEEFGDRFGRPTAEFDQVIEWLKMNGFQIDQAWPNHLSVSFSATADIVERAFRVEMGRFSNQTENRIFYSNRQGPSLPPEIESITSSLVGLNDADEFKVSVKPRPPISGDRQRQGSSDKSWIEPQGKTTTGGNYLAPADLAGAYNYKPLADAGFRGQGQRVAIVIHSDMADSDIALYRNFYGLPSANVRRFVPPSYTNPGIKTGEPALECALDVASITAVAPMAEIDIILIPDLLPRSVTDAELYIVNTLGIPIVNESFGGCEPFLFSASEQTLFRQAVTQGIAFFASTGDEGAECTVGGLKAIECPACYDGVTAVGGTQIDGNYNSNGDLISIALESVWNDPPGVRLACDGKTPLGGATGGGFSQRVAQPDYQVNASGFTGGVPSGAGRVVPDISALAGRPGTFIAINNGWLLRGGTSQSSPLWAGMMTLINQFKGSAQGSPNRELYRLGVNEYRNGGPAVFRDIVVGNNSTGPRQPCVPSGVTGVSATFGYDAATGWGVPNLDLLARSFGVTQSGNNPPVIISLAASLENDSLILTGMATDLDGDIVQAQSRTFNSSGVLVGQTSAFDVSLGTTPSVSFSIPLSNLNAFPTAVRGSLILIDSRGNRSAEVVADFSQADPGGPTISSVSYAGKKMKIKGRGLAGNLTIEINGRVVAAGSNDDDARVIIKGSPVVLNVQPGPNRFRVRNSSLRSNIYLLDF